MHTKIGVLFCLIGGVLLLFQGIETMMDSGLAWKNYTIFDMAPDDVTAWIQGLAFPWLRKIILEIVHLPLFAISFIAAVFFFILNAIYGE